MGRVDIGPSGPRRRGALDSDESMKTTRSYVVLPRPCDKSCGEMYVLPSAIGARS